MICVIRAEIPGPCMEAEMKLNRICKRSLNVSGMANLFSVEHSTMIRPTLEKESRATLACLYRTSGRVLHATNHIC